MPAPARRHSRLLSLLLAATLAACGGGGGDGTATGQLSLRVTDGPVDEARHVYMQFRGIELHGPGGTRTFYYCQDPDTSQHFVSTAACAHPAPRQLDLLALTGGESAQLLDREVLRAGRYQWARLLVDAEPGVRDSYIVIGENEYPLGIPSGDETGLKLNRGFTVPAGGLADFTVDFDLRKSVHGRSGDEYLLRPTLRIVDNVQVGAIAGEVNAALVTQGCSPAVYVYSGAGVVPDDIDGASPDPVTTVLVKPHEENGVTTYRYKAAFLEAGDYTVAITCQAAADDPATDDALAYTGAAAVAVAAKAVTTHDFPASLP